MPYVTLEKNGIIRLNRIACELLEITIGEKLNVLQDEDRPKDWYLEKTSDEDGLIMRKHSSSGSICSNSKPITVLMRNSIGIQQQSVRFRLATQSLNGENKVYAILTSSINKEIK